MKTSNAKCHICGRVASLWYKGKWWCAMTQGFGNYNMKGICNEKTNDKSNS
jgi:hypothetical protein